MPHTPSTIGKTMKLSASFYTAASLVAAKDDVRFYLKGVRIEPAPQGGALIVASDGHRILVAHDSMAEDVETCILPIVKVPAKCDFINVTLGDQVSFNFGAVTVVASKIEGTYPDWRKVLPAENKAQQGYDAIVLNAAYIAETLKISKALGASKNNVIRVTHEGLMTSVFFAGQPCHYHIMGVRHDGLEFPKFTV